MTGVGAVSRLARVEAGRERRGDRLRRGRPQRRSRRAVLEQAALVIAIDRDPAQAGAGDALRRDRMRSSADDATLDAVKSLTAGRGADHVFEAAGAEASLQLALEVTRPGGQLVILGKTAVNQRGEPALRLADGREADHPLELRRRPAAARLPVAGAALPRRQARARRADLVAPAARATSTKASMRCGAATASATSSSSTETRPRCRHPPLAAGLDRPPASALRDRRPAARIGRDAARRLRQSYVVHGDPGSPRSRRRRSSSARRSAARTTGSTS